MLSWGGAAAIGVLVLILILCLIFSWRGSRSLQVVARGLDALAEGRTVELPTKGFAGELAEKLNQTSAQLQYRNEIIQQRDTARTNWIAGVSHDIRTPLSLILGWAEQMQRDTQLPDPERKNQIVDRRSEPDQQIAVRSTAVAMQNGSCRATAAYNGCGFLQRAHVRTVRSGTGT